MTTRPVQPGAFPHGVVSVLGMHRSGTSCLTGSLQLAGLCLGDHSTWNPFNLKGNRENPAINDLHDDLLAANGGRWDRPPPVLEWSPPHVARAKEIIATYPTDRRWGFKDPKTLQAIEGWRSLLGEMLHIGIFRHPVAVAGSLRRRDGLSLEHALELWRNYNRKLLDEHDRKPFPLLSFDWDEDTFHEKLNGVLPTLDLDPLEGERFFAAELRQYRKPDGEEPVILPPAVEALYAELQARAI